MSSSKTRTSSEAPVYVRWTPDTDNKPYRPYRIPSLLWPSRNKHLVAPAIVAAAALVLMCKIMSDLLPSFKVSLDLAAIPGTSTTICFEGPPGRRIQVYQLADNSIKVHDPPSLAPRAYIPFPENHIKASPSKHPHAFLAREVDSKTKTLIVGFSLLGTLALACLIIMVERAIRFFRDSEVREMWASRRGSAIDDGRKGHLVGAGTLMG